MSATSFAYRVARGFATVSAASKGPKALVRQQGRRYVYRSTFRATKRAMRGFKGW